MNFDINEIRKNVDNWRTQGFDNLSTEDRLRAQVDLTNYAQFLTDAKANGEVDEDGNYTGAQNGNSAQDGVGSIGESTAIVTSSDKENEFRENSQQLDSKLTLTNQQQGQVPEDQQGFRGTTVDEDYNTAYGDDADLYKRLDEEATRKREEYESLYQTALAEVDEEADSLIQSLNATYAKRIEEQRKAEQRNIDRVKAYGLSGGGAYVPVMFNEAISEREQEASSVISGLEDERRDLIRQAERARKSGKADVLKERMERLQDTEDRLKESLKEIRQESEEQYDLLRKFNQEREAEHQTKVNSMKERITARFMAYADQYDEMSQEDRDKLIQTTAEKLGMSYMDVFDAFTAGQDKINAGELSKLEVEKERAGIDKIYADVRQGDAESKALVAQRYASADASNALAEERRRVDPDGDDEDIEMQLEIPSSFASEEDAEKQRLAYIQKHGKSGQLLWDETFDRRNKSNTKKDVIADYPISEEEKKGNFFTNLFRSDAKKASQGEQDPLGLGI